MSAAAPPMPAAGTAPPPKAPTAKEQKKSEQMANANGGEEDEEEPLVTDTLENKDIHEILRELRKDEVAELAQSGHNRRTVKINHIIPGTQTVDNYFSLVALETERYLKYVFGSWWNFFTSLMFGGLGLFDAFSVFFFAFGGTILLGVVLVFCLGMHFPMLVRLYYRWADKYGGGLGLVNSGNPNLFKALTTAQAEAAKRALSRPIKENKDTETQRFFNYDIAKFLLQLASVVYEHENDSIRAAVEITTDLKPSTFLPTSAAATAEIMTNLAPSINLPGKLIDKLFPGDASAKVDSALKNSKGDKAIRDFAKHFGIDFEPVSELNNTSSAFCGFFWDPNSNWIVVAFKGTAPIEFSEWLSDFNAKLVPAGSYIDGFTKVHKGFKDRLFPDDVTELGGTRPYDTIALALKTLAKWLRKRQPKGTQINVWVTGHSLGCATASLAYSRWLMRHKDMGKKSVLRDAYLFAAPIVCDRASVDVFNAKMSADPKRRKTMWRITSNGDAVATCLPELGDYRSITVSPNNAFAFAHLGTEIKMRDHPYRSHVTGNHITHGALVQIDSEFNADQIAQQRADKYKNPGEQKREWIGVALQKIPLIGRFVAHCTIYYWDQLDRVALTQCEWVIN